MPLGNPIRKQNESRMVSVLATEGQTVFTVQGGYIINHISVFRNGVRLSPAEDFTAGDGSTVTLNNAANIDDRIDFHIFDRFTVQNAIVGAASSQIISGDLTLTGKLFGELDVPSINTGIVTATELDLNGKGDISSDLTIGRHLNVVGVTTTGSLISNGSVGIGTTGARGATVEIQDIGSTGPCLLLAGATNAEGDLAIPIDQDFNIGHWNNVDTFTERFKIDTTGTIEIPGDVSARNITGVAATLTGNLTINNTQPGIILTDTGDNPDYKIENANGIFNIYDETNTESRFRINSSGQIGIGTVTPNRQVHQHVRSSAANYYQWTNDTTGVSATSGLLVGITAAEEGLVWNYGNTALRFGSGNAEAFRVDSSQRLLLGTTSVGNASAYYDNLVISNTTSGEGSGITLFAATNGYNAIDFGDTAVGRGRITYFHGDDRMMIDVGGSEAIRILSTGVVGINTVGARGATFEIQDIGSTGPTLLLAGGTATEGDIAVPDGQDINIGHWNNSDTFTERLHISHTTGRIGINKSNPETNLHIVGGSDTGLRITSSDGGTSSIQLGDASDTVIGGISCLSDSSIRIRGNNNTDRIVISSGGNVAIGPNFNAPNALLHVGGYDNAGGDVAIRIHNDTGTDSGSTASLLFTVSPTDNFDAQILRYYRESNNFVVQYSTNNPTIVLTNDQKLRVGGAAHTVDPICGTGGIDIQAMGSTGAFPFVGGADGTSGAVTRSANTEKQFRMGYPTYGNGSGTLCSFAYMKSDGTDNEINIGGGTGWGYAATEVNIYGAANDTTTTGTLISKFNYRGTHGQFWYDTDISLWNNSDAGSAMNYQGGDGVGSLSLKTDRATNYSNIYLNKTNTGNGADTRWISFYWNGTSKGYLRYESDDVVLAQDSDYRLKTNIADLTNCIDKVKLLKPVSYNWNGLLGKPTDIVRHGFVAHELSEVIPQAVMGAKDATKTDEDGNENVIDPQQIEQKYIIPTLTKALQEAIAKIETLEAKVAALEGS